MQNVAWATITVSSDRPPNRFTNVWFSARPVTMPGSAIGSTTMNETVLRPKKSNRDTAIASSVPSSSAIAAAPSATFSDSRNASRAPWLWIALSSQWVVKPANGHRTDFESLNAYSPISPSGTHRKISVTALPIRRLQRRADEVIIAATSQAAEGTQPPRDQEVDDHDRHRHHRVRGGERHVGAEVAVHERADELVPGAD